MEMPLVSYVERNNINKVKVVALGCFMMAVSLFLMLINTWAGILIIMMMFMTFGEMFAFPFSNSVALSRAPKGHEGRYMAIYTMSFSLAHIFSSKIGMEIIDNFGYQINWFVMGTLGLLATLAGLHVFRLIEREHKIL
jgi:MFS family permease